jgi:hypothetical protein
MLSDVPPPTTVLTLVFLAWAAGTIVGSATTRLGSEIQAGHFKVVWLVAAGLSLAAGFGYRPAWLAALACLLTFGALYRDADRVAGLAAAAIAVAVLATGSDLSVQAFAAAALMGAVTNAMLLGHWHLNQPKLGTKPIARVVVALWGAVGLYVVTAAMMTVLSSSGGGVKLLAAVTALAFAVFAGVLTAPVHHLVHTRSIMSATGILYLEILLCFVAVFTGSVAALTG